VGARLDVRLQAMQLRPPGLQVVIAAVAVSMCATALATSSVSFEAEGYLLDIVVGGDSRPSIAGLSLAMPGSAHSVAIPVQHLKVEAFDTTQKILTSKRMVKPPANRRRMASKSNSCAISSA